MQGELADASIGEVCRGLARADATGTLHVESSLGEASLRFRDGMLIAVKVPHTPARLGDRLVHAGLLSRDDLERAVRAQQAKDHPTEYLGELLVSDGLVDADAVRVFLQEQILDALVDILAWPDGRYNFTRHDVRERPIMARLKVDRALSEATRRILESRRVERFLPDRSAHVVAVPDMDPVELEPDEAAVLAAFGEGDTIEGAASSLGFGVHDTARIAWGLRLLGLVDVSVAPGAPQTHAPLVPGDDEVTKPPIAPAVTNEPGPAAPTEPDEPHEQDILDTVRVEDDDSDRPRRRLFGRSN
ncbi:MAG: DUF4388 domain-containing protein [Nitriliruptorales bacterium]|nr:DUF4388 domain-containing protein [Nitriliruptorales bacterium]